MIEKKRIFFVLLLLLPLISLSSSWGLAQGGEGGGGGGGGGGSYGPRQMFSVTCSNCGSPAEVPFQPRGDRPVYCNDCFANQRQQQRY